MKYYLTILAISVSLMSMAQDGNRHGQRDSLSRFTPEQHAALKTKKLTLALDLSAEQQRKVEALELQRAQRREQLRESGKGPGDEGARAIRDAEAHYNGLSGRLDQQIAFQREMKTILTEAQYTKWKSMLEKHGKKRHRRHGKKSREHQPKHAH